ncbi:MAG: beta-ketoacyl-ACP synthase II [Oscillospiraceae bacterium]|jgi:3-oxoacyl-[acyl-carrier-protein] synthase II|nr:beta-ketoacyl-ACP synthase II [Oscillospiraceae bacterium]
MRRVVVTGMSTVNPIGNNIEEYWNNIVGNKIGFSPVRDIRENISEDFEVKLAGDVKNFDPQKYIEKKECKRLDRFTQFAVYCAKDVLAQTEYVIDDPYRCGVILGCGIGGLDLTLSEHEKYLDKGPGRISVFYVPMMIANMAAGCVSINTGFKGANYAAVTACASSANAIGEAFQKIKHGYLDSCLCGGTESCISEFTLGSFNNMRALTRSSDPYRASVPFDKQRNGFVLGEGAAVLLLEEYEHAVKRGAKIYAEIAGYGATCDGYHITSPAPDGKAVAAAMKAALQEAGIDGVPDYINAHGTSTELNDKYETTAIKLAFGDKAHDIKINSTKSMTGHLLGAAGAIEAVAVILQMNNSLIHRTVGYSVPDEECDLDYCVNGNVQMQIRTALSNSLGFGGHNACLCFKKEE